VDPFQQAWAAFERGAMAEAETACLVALRDHPEQPDVNHLCGLVSYRLGRLTEAQQRLENAARLAPGNAFVHSNLSLVLRDDGEFRAAAESARQAIALDPELADAHNNLGTILKEQEHVTGAEACFRRAAELDVRNPFFQTNLASSLLVQGRLDEAELFFGRVLGLEPQFGPALAGLGALRARQRRWGEAYALLDRAIQAGSREPEAYNNLGLTRHKLKDAKGAVQAFQQALERRPAFGGAYYNLGLVLEDMGNFKVAAEMYEKALTCGHDTTGTVKSLLHVATRSGDLDNAALRVSRLLDDPLASVELFPAAIGVLSHTCDFTARATTWQQFLDAVRQGKVSEAALGEALMHSTYDASLTEETVVQLHRRWGVMVAERLGAKSYREHPAVHIKSDRLRIAYLSPDFRHHSVGYFIRNVLANHDRQLFEVICYSLTKREDDLTHFIREHVDRFVNVTAFDEIELAQRIRTDGVQILVDLAGHSESNRLPALALRPASMQLTWIGYLHTTGLAAVDYRIADSFVDDQTVEQGPEQRLVLPECFLCFGCFPETEIDPVPAVQRIGSVTFASFNNLMKVTDRAVALWARVLAQVPRSKMLVMTGGAGSEIVQVNLRAEFARHGIEPERLVFRDPIPRHEYFKTHNEVDVILDTFPFNGGTVTAGALWMGVPVVTLVGKAYRQRVSYSMLKNIGVEDTIAWNEDEYVLAAVSLARNPARFAELRARIAASTRRSILCNAPRFTRQLEAALLQAWAERRASAEEKAR